MNYAFKINSSHHFSLRRIMMIINVLRGLIREYRRTSGPEGYDISGGQLYLAYAQSFHIRFIEKVCNYEIMSTYPSIIYKHRASVHTLAISLCFNLTKLGVHISDPADWVQNPREDFLSSFPISSSINLMKHITKQ